MVNKINAFSHEEPQMSGTVSFIIDSGASEHLVTSNVVIVMFDVKTLENSVFIRIANGENLESHQRGSSKLLFENTVINLSALIVPTLAHNLLSMRKIIFDLPIGAECHSADKLLWHRRLGHLGK
ncbi:hypothetical protein PR048_005724 [Dryococelus australis]|uniref:Retrovirus-related Pol polyprotein from transposon TNT 1-94-like beta-barrel domain-containing protein n=1 Tax=Dryococelus australis TaxID=614101 RepID=A0ABQ9I918_9NEOP|nr:hypothetical protein PR048_005724 [Dryococelus australis]